MVGCLIEYVRKGLICKSIPNLKCKNSEVICSELTVRNKRWIIFSLCRPSNPSNLHEFFNELETSLDQALKIYDNVIVMGDINIDLHDPNSGGLENLIALCETYNLKNLIKTKACFTKNHTSSIDVILTNRTKFFILL